MGRVFWIISALVFVSVACASDLMAPYWLDNSRVLPPGIRNPHFLQFFGNLSTRYDGEGNSIPLGFRTNVRVSWKDVLEIESNKFQKNLIRALLQDGGLDPNGSPGNATGAVNVHADVKAPIFAMGVTPNLTLAVVVPIISLDAKVDTGFVRSEEGQNFVDALCKQSPEKCNEAAAKLNRATDQKINQYGYQPLTSQSVSSIGDIQIYSKYRWFGDEDQGFALRMGFVLPTGIAPNVDRALDLATGDGRFKVGPTLFYDLKPFEKSRVSLYAGYLALLPNAMQRRIPYSAENSLSDDKVTLVRQWGENWMAGATVDYTAGDSGMTLSAGYNYQYQSQTHYQRDGLTDNQKARLGFLENLDATQTLHSVLARVSFSTVDWYLKKKFVLPFQLSALVSHPIAGANAPTNDIVSGEAVFFF